MSEILISFIIAVFNNEKYLPNAIKSICTYDGVDIEIIIVDDGSTDDTPQIADSFAEKDSRISVLHQKNQWIYASFNNGIKIAKGEYIYILNSDDQLAQSAVQILIDAIKRYSYPDVIWTRVIDCAVDENQNIQSQKDYNKAYSQEIYVPQMVENRQLLIELLERGYLINQANLYKKKLCIEHPFRNDYYGADELFNISILPDIKCAAVLIEEIYYYFIYPMKEMNVSIGKYYGYEHEMYNEFYIRTKEAFLKMNAFSDRVKRFIISKRKHQLGIEINSIISDEKKQYSEIMQALLYDLIDSTVMEVFEDTREELDARIINGLIRYYLKNPHEDGKYRFVYDIVRILSQYEKTDEEMDILNSAINNENNPYQIGKSFYDRLIGLKQ